MKNKIGIIGDGQLGTRLFKSFKKNGFNVRCYSRKNGFDLKDPSVLNEILYENTAVINCAAMTNVDGCEIEKQEAMHLNAIIPAILGSINSYNDCKIVHISTDYVYGDAQMEGGVPKDNSEDGFCIPVNFYGESKLAGDRALLNNEEIKDRLLILRPSWLFDYESKNSIVARLFDKFESGNNGNAIKVVDDIYGIPTSCDTIYDAVHSFIYDKLQPGCYNIRQSRVEPDEVVTMYDVAEYISQYFPAEKYLLERVKHTDFKTTAARQMNSYLDIYKLHAQGIYPKVWCQSIDDFIKFKMNEECRSD